MSVKSLNLAAPGALWAVGAGEGGGMYCASHKNWTSVHQLSLQNHCFIGSGGGSRC